MDRMSLVSLLIISIPEFILDIFLAFLVTGQKSKLELNKRNVFRILVAVGLMAISTYTIRKFAINMNLIPLISMVAYLIILKLVFNTSWFVSFLSVLIMVASIITIELIYIPQCVEIISKNVSKVYSDDFLRFLYSIPERLIQILIITKLWKLNAVLVDMKKYKKIGLISSVMIMVLLVFELAFALIFVNTFDTMSLLVKVVSCLLLLLCVVINLIAFKLITIVTKTIKLEVKKQEDIYKNEMETTREIINFYLHKKDINKVANIIESQTKDKENKEKII